MTKLKYWIAFLLVPLGGCQSVYKGEKLDAEGNFGDAKFTGIPYVMTAPEYTLTRDDAAAPARYTVKMGYVPDPSQRYTLRLRPAITSTVTFDMDLGTDGELASVSNKLTDQIVPTVKALFSFVLSTVGTVAKVASGAIRAAPQLTDVERDYVECMDQRTDARQSWCAIGEAVGPEACSAAAAGSLQQRITDEFFEPIGETDAEEAKPDRGDIFASLHYSNPGEQACLQKAARGIDNAGDTVAITLKNKLDDELPDPAALAPDDARARTLFKARLKSIIDQANTAGGRRLVQAVEVALGPAPGDDQLFLTRRELGDAKVTPNQDELKAWKLALEALKIWKRNVMAILDAELPTDYSDLDRMRFKAAVKKIVKERNQEDVKELLQSVNRNLAVDAEGAQGAVREELLKRRRALEAMEIATLDPDEWNKLPGAPIESLARAKRVAAGLQAIANLEVDKWRGRHIAYLDKKIESKALADMAGGSFSDPGSDPDIMNWRRQIATTAYKRVEYERLQKVETVLNEIPPRASPPISPFEEYGRARVEADRLKLEIAQAAETLVAGAQSAPAAARPLPLSVPRVPASCIKESVEGGVSWYYGEGATAPEFVIVLERPGGGPTATEACPWTELQ